MKNLTNDQKYKNYKTRKILRIIIIILSIITIILAILSILKIVSIIFPLILLLAKSFKNTSFLIKKWSNDYLHLRVQHLSLYFSTLPYSKLSHS